MAQMTTAQALVAFSNELRDGGMAPDLADDLVRIVARDYVAGNGFCVADSREA